jgi:hypothetical protein
MYLRHIRQQSCLVCLTPQGIQAHHLRHVGGKGMGTKTGDQWAVPMCYPHHRDCHEMGDEFEYWLDVGFDAQHWATNTYRRWKEKTDGKAN